MLVYKPGSVMHSHLSRTYVTISLKQPTRINTRTTHVAKATLIPIWSCSKWGLPCHCCYQQRGALLPHLFTLTITSGFFSVALAVEY